MPRLTGKTIAIMVANGFEQVEMTDPKNALEKEGARVVIVSPEKTVVEGWHHMKKGEDFPIDKSLKEASPDDYDALLLPGGVHNPDKLRLIPEAVEFIKKIHQQNKPIAAICHGPWLLINSNIAKGSKLTSWPSIKQDLINAGANWVDQSVVCDNQMVTSRKPDDLPDFNREMIALFEKG